MVVERNEGEAPPLVAVLLGHDVHFLDFAELDEVVAQVLLVCVLFDSSDEDLLHRGMSARPARVLKTKSS